MIQMREWLADYEEFDKPQKICFEDGRTVGQETSTLIWCLRSKKIVMCNILYVPKLAVFKKI